MDKSLAFFAPELFFRNGLRDISFYQRAFGAKELRRFSNSDGSIHVVEMSIQGALFHMHEAKQAQGELAPEHCQGTTVRIGLFTTDPDALMAKAVNAGAELVSPIQDFDYGYRQGIVKDPNGHVWQIQSRV
ncbi:MAG: VOC family protein [Bacteroidetes bacterium]|nr:VOC family protein [Bacteroidota bacterium]MBS1978235.1 VOC family protein [Bacteroidota bacterium]